MPLRPCLRCGDLVEGGSYCPRHQPEPSRTDALRGGSTAAAAFRAEVLRRAGNRCQAVEPGGERCDVAGAAQLQAHHVRPLALGGHPTDPVNGVAVCGPHHRRAEVEAFDRADVRSPT